MTLFSELLLNIAAQFRIEIFVAINLQNGIIELANRNLMLHQELVELD